MLASLAAVLAAAVLAAPRSAVAAAPSASPQPMVPSTPTPTQTPPPLSYQLPTPGGNPSGVTLGPTFTSSPTPSEARPTPVQGAGADDPGLFDVSGHVKKAIDDWFRDLVESALDPVLTFLGQTILATPDVSSEYRVREMWGVSAGIANALVVLLVLIGGAVVMGHETVQTRYTAKEIAPRIVVGMIAANVSLSLVGVAVHFANALSQVFLGQGVDPVNATAAIRDLVLFPVATGGIFVIFLAGVVAVIAVLLVCLYILRVSLLIMLVTAAPLALVCHALPQTEGLAQLWWRAVIGCLAVQVGQALVLVTALRVLFDSDHHALGFRLGGSVVDMVLVICLLWVLFRIPAWVGRFVFSGMRHSGSTVGRAVKYAVLFKAIRAAGFLA